MDVKANIAAILFVDDIDIIHLTMDKSETAVEAHAALQASVTNWGNLLIASGGALKPPKCFSHIFYFCWKSNGTWRYDASKNNEDMVIRVPTPTGEDQEIDNLLADRAKETLGVFTAPSGCSAKAVEVMKGKASDWTGRALGSSCH